MYPICTDEEKTKILELLLNAGKQRTYLTLAAYKFLIDLFEKVNFYYFVCLIFNMFNLQIDAKEFEKLVFPLIKTELSNAWQIQNLDSLYLILEIQRYFPQSLHTKFLKNNLGTSEVLCLESLPHVCNTLTVSYKKVLCLFSLRQFGESKIYFMKLIFISWKFKKKK